MSIQFDIEGLQVACWICIASLFCSSRSLDLQSVFTGHSHSGCLKKSFLPTAIFAKVGWVFASCGPVCYIPFTFDPLPILKFHRGLNLVNTKCDKCIKSIWLLLNHCPNWVWVNNKMFFAKCLPGFFLYEIW